MNLNVSFYLTSSLLLPVSSLNAFYILCEALQIALLLKGAMQINPWPALNVRA